jgi:hypothetical protein
MFDQRVLTTHDFAKIHDLLSTLSEPENYCDQDDPDLHYWRIIYEMLLNGDIQLAVATLSLHSEIRDSSSISHVVAVDFKQCKQLFDLMLSHPYCSKGDHAVAASSPVMNSLADWHADLAALRSGGSTVLARLPELDTALRIMLGDSSSHMQLSSGNWMRLLLLKLLYKYPSQAGRGSLIKIVDESVADAKKNGRHRDIEKEDR